MSTELKSKDDTTDFNQGCIRLRSVQLMSRYLLFVEEYDTNRYRMKVSFSYYSSKTIVWCSKKQLNTHFVINR